MQDNDGLDFGGLKAIRQLSKEGIPINVTLIMTPEQGLLAAKAGAAYASPFAGRIDDHIRTKLGLKRGTDFGKGDHFDYELLKRTRDKKLDDSINDFGSASHIYQSREVGGISALSQDNGVLSGVDLTSKILRIYQNYMFNTELIAASIRNPRQAREMAELGVHIATLPLDVIRGMIKHYKTVEGMKSFTADVVPQYRNIFERK
jgi:transaldolase